MFKNFLFEFNKNMYINNINNSYFNQKNRGITFRGHNVLSLRTFRELKDVCCVYCGHRMLTGGEIREYARKATEIKGVPLAKYLMSLQPDMKPNEKRTACLIKEELKRHPGMDLKDILLLLFPRHVERLERQQEKVLLELQKIAVDFPKHDKDIVSNQVQIGLNEITKKSKNEHFKRNKYISNFFTLNDKFEDFGNYIRIIEAIKAMPNTHTSLDAFIVKYSRKSPYDIATRLLTPSQVTIEHLQPRSLGGTSIITNVVLACGRDNSTRRSQPLSIMTGLGQNLPVYFQSFRKASRNKFSKYDLSEIEKYIQGVKQTINNLLKNDIKIVDPSKGRYF